VPRTVVITGAFGFLGRHTARRAAQRGDIVIGMGHGGWPAQEWSACGLRAWHEGDITVDLLARCGGVPDAILHFAGGSSVPFSLANPLLDFERTVVTTAHVLDYVRAYSPATRVVYCSSASVYGVADRFPIAEESRCAPVSPYGVNKLLAEQLIASYSRQFQLSASIVRLFSVYGPGLRKQLLWDACRKLSRRERVFMGTGQEVRDWLHVDDAASLMLAAMENADATCPIVNGGSGAGVTIREILLHTARSLGLSGGELEFSLSPRQGDPSCYIADVARARAWEWLAKKQWRDGVAEYVAWWLLENQQSEPDAALVSVSENAA
jgi:UDP-glucose 4-epimerase